MVKFLRRTWYKYSKLGQGRKKKQKWRRPTGRDNKLREKRKNRGPVVSIGYKKDVTSVEKKPIVYNENDLRKIKKGTIVILGKVGKKKKIEIVELAKKKGILIYRLNIDKFLKKITEGKNESK